MKTILKVQLIMADSFNSIILWTAMTTPTEWVQFFTLIVLLITAFLQWKTTKMQKQTVELMDYEFKFKMMPYFDIVDKGGTLLLMTNKTTAFDVTLELTGDPKMIENIGKLDDKVDIIEPGEIFNTLDLHFTIRHIFILEPKLRDKERDVLNIKFSDYSDRKYYQRIFLRNAKLYISKPVELKRV